MLSVAVATRTALLLLSTVDRVEDGTYAVFLMVLGLGIIGYGYSRHRERQLIRDTPTSQVESMSVGAVEVSGTVEAAAATVPALLTGDECAVVVYDVEEYRWSDDGREWRTQDAGVAAEPFYLDDGTGRVLVDPTDWSADYDISDADCAREQYDDTADQPPAVTAFLAEYTTEPGHTDRKRRYTQEIIPIGAEAYVFGDAELPDNVESTLDPDEDAADLVVTEDADSEMFLVSDKNESELADDRRYSLALGGFIGIAVFSVGLWWFLSVLGV